MSQNSEVDKMYSHHHGYNKGRESRGILIFNYLRF